MPDAIGSEGECQRHAVLGIPVYAVRVDLLHDLGDGIGPGLPSLTSPLIPHHHGKKYALSAFMKVLHHLANTGQAAGHGPNHVMLITVVDSYVRIGGPDQHRVDASVSLLQIVQITVYGVFLSYRIVKISILHHHLRLNEFRLRPLQRRHVVSRTVITDANPPLCPPMRNVYEPLLMRRICARRIASLPCTLQREAARRRNLLTT